MLAIGPMHEQTMVEIAISPDEAAVSDTKQQVLLTLPCHAYIYTYIYTYMLAYIILSNDKKGPHHVPIGQQSKVRLG